MRGRLLILMLWATLVVPATPAQAAEPTLYFFWSASCPYSKTARAFLLNAQQKDAGLAILEFEVDQSLPNTLLLGRLYDMIGLPEFWVVPVAVIGHNVVIGYIDDETTGKEILDHVAECRKTGCPDAVQKLLEQPGRYDEASAPSSSKRVGCVQDRNASQALQAGKGIHARTTLETKENFITLDAGVYHPCD